MNGELVTEVTFPETQLAINDYSFAGASEISKVNIHNSMKTIGKGAFIKCTGLTEIRIPSSVETIAADAFKFCNSLTGIEIPNSVTSLGAGAFENCRALNTVILSNSIPYIGYELFLNCTALTSIDIPNCVTDIGSSAFEGCTSLETVAIGNSVTTIGGKAFFGCPIKEVVLPEELTSLGENVFGETLDKVYSLNATPPTVAENTFPEIVFENATLHVRKGSLVHYWLDPVWKKFTNISDNVLCLEVIPDARYGDGEIELAEYAPEGVKLRYESSNQDVVAINGTKMRIVGAGSATIGAILDEGDSEMELMGQLRQFNVSQAELTVSVADIEIMEGEPLPEFTYTIEGLVYEDTTDDIELLPEARCDVTENSPAGEYPVYFTEGKDPNYNITTKAAKVTVKQASGIDSVGTNDDSDILVYDLNGCLVYSGPRSQAKLASGFYILRHGSMTAKVFVK